VSVIRIGITGASGFLGTSLLAHFAPRDDVHVVALTRTIGPVQVSHESNLEWRQVDLASARDCETFVADVDVVIHLAHTNTPLTSNRNMPSDAATNTTSTLTLLDAIRTTGSRPHVVFPSSGGALYRPSPNGVPVAEDAAVEPLTSYGILKLAFEQYLRMAAHEGWLTATILRIGNPYGILLPPERLQGLVGVAMRNVLEGRPVRVFGDLENVRDYVHLDDVCRAFDRALEPRSELALYNIGSGRGRTVREVLATLSEVAGYQVSVERDESIGGAKQLPHGVVLDVSKVRRELSWEATVEFQDGIAAMWIAAGPT
jgi:UDP-glucose 4-epimerase